jgi:hypothetical protein
MEKGNNPQYCHRCGGELEFGWLKVYEDYFAKKAVLFESEKINETRIAASTCMKCGHLELFIYPKEFYK